MTALSRSPGDQPPVRLHPLDGAAADTLLLRHTNAYPLPNRRSRSLGFTSSG